MVIDFLSKPITLSMLDYLSNKLNKKEYHINIYTEAQK
jgi:hypothetical protein